MLYRADLLSPAKVKEKALKALFARKLIEKGWLSALIGGSRMECLCLVYRSSSEAKTNFPSTIAAAAWSCQMGQLNPITVVMSIYNGDPGASHINVFSPDIAKSN